MKITIINCFETYEERVDLLIEYFLSKGHEVKVIQSNFEHMKKRYRSEEKKYYTFIHTPKYKKNFSISRMLSHYIFAKKATQKVKEMNPDLVYSLIPPNFLSAFLIKYKKENKNTKLIFDLIDLWPETFPVQKIKQLFPFNYWKSLRKNGLAGSDLVISECNLYREIIENELEGIKCETVYLAKDKSNSNIVTKVNLNDDLISFCYLGSINNIIDIEKISTILYKVNLNKKVKLHIIGDGEKKESLIKELQSKNIEVVYHGKIYDEQKKQLIFDQCHFGINIMKDQVCVGLTMKSIDYFRAGLPIINSIKSDTKKMLEDYNSGINIGFDKNKIHDYEINKIISYSNDKNLLLRKNTMKMYEERFTKECFMKNIDIALNDLLIEVNEVI
ncbi:hypothetical protein AYO36_00860 [Exiguobacterium sp. KKBO11]|uniref:hypothetical protein n=1 Tax=Exiguobacterium sp. KKBO11 TaxID=1805000 RepID=UPI0007D81E8C|nr:hypothetical protein [Exiguobacterium sp. KKBO11]OAI88720.1 hypothetical protein AYO36_00860 [Exiguobacterium sp. KKBO11]